jgi:hypothetical protein
MLTTTIDVPNIPPLWYSAVQQIQAVTEPPWLIYPDSPGRGLNYIFGVASTVSTNYSNPLSIERLGWNSVETLETHLRFRSFAEDWDSPGMEAYDDM